VHWAAKAGQILGYCAIAFGIAVDWFTGQLVNGLWIVLLGWFSIRNAMTAYVRDSCKPCSSWLPPMP